MTIMLINSSHHKTLQPPSVQIYFFAPHFEKDSKKNGMGRREVEVEEEELGDTEQDRCRGGPKVAGDITFFFF